MDKSRQLKYADWVIRFISVLIIFIGGYWLIQWLSGSATHLASYWSSSGKIIMKANMSFLIMLFGTSLFLIGLPVNSIIPKWISGTFAAIVFIIGVLTLIENVFNVKVGIDQLLASEPKGAIGTMSPNRIGLPGSLSLTFLGAGFLLLVTGKRKMATLMGLIVCVINLVPASGYLLNIGLFYSNTKLTSIAWPTVLALMLSGFGLIFIKPGNGLKDLIVSDQPGDILIRKLLPAIILIPLVIGFIIIHGEKLIFYDATISTGIQMVMLILLFSLIAFRIRNIVNRINASRKYSENSLRESEKKYRLIFETANEGIWITDNNRITIMVNYRLSEMLGYPIHEILGKTSSEFLFEDQEEIRQEISKILKSGIKTSREFKFRRKDGSILWAISNASPVFDDKGELIKTVSLLTDITKRKRAENELNEAKEKLNLALESGNIGVWEWDLKTNETIWDERMQKMFGLEPGSFKNTYNAFINLVHEEDITHIEKAISETLRNGNSYVNLYRTKPVNGKIKYITSRAVVSKIEDGKPVSLIGVCFDVTWLSEQTELTILKLNEELLRSNKELENFAYIASHDLQEPLRMVSCFTQLLSQQYHGQLDERARDYIHFAVEGSNRMYELLNGLLAYSRINTKGKNFTEVNTNHIIADVRKNLSLKIKERNAMIDVGNLPVIQADGTQMIQLFQNLISNAIKFSPGNPDISISSEKNGNHYSFAIKDHGLGIEYQYFEKIFNIFQRLLPREKYEGTGIGLAICKRIVERHGGKIWLESEPEKGSTFFFTIPMEN
jgi:two-component system, chemotaxis family, sensor kinase Cph1